jgi:hypothetical protein
MMISSRVTALSNNLTERFNRSAVQPSIEKPRGDEDVRREVFVTRPKSFARMRECPACGWR